MRVYFTVATCNYLAYVKALAVGLKLQEPEALFFALFVDRPVETKFFENLDFPVHYAEDVVEHEWFRRASYYYSAFELSNSLKPVGHRLAMDVYCASEWAYVDSDIQILGPLSVLWENCYDIILTPHYSKVLPGAQNREDELTLLRYGSANGGVLACRRSSAAMEFVAWYEEALRERGFSEWRYSYVDQKWLDVVLSLFPSAGYCRYLGINVGHWNLREHKLEKNKGGPILIGGVPVLILHFSRWSPDTWWKVPENIAGVDTVIWADIGKTYRDILIECGLGLYRVMPYRYDRDRKGHVLTAAMRRAYFENRLHIVDPWLMTNFKQRSIAILFLFDQFKAITRENRRQIRAWFKLR